MSTHTAASIATDIQSGISDGTYPYDTALPAAGELAGTYGVSRPTIVSALARLSLLGLVRVGSGAPARVIAGRASASHLGTFGPPDLSVGTARQPTNGGTGETRTTEVRHVRAHGIEGLEDGEPVVERTRVYSVDGVPAQHKLTVLPVWVAERKPDGYEGIAPMMSPPGGGGSTPPGRFYDWAGIGEVVKNTSITVEPMLDSAAEVLGMPEGTPAFRATTVTRDVEGRTVDVLIQTVPLHHRLTITAS